MSDSLVRGLQEEKHDKDDGRVEQVVGEEGLEADLPDIVVFGFASFALVYAGPKSVIGQSLGRVVEGFIGGTEVDVDGLGIRVVSAGPGHGSGKMPHLSVCYSMALSSM